MVGKDHLAHVKMVIMDGDINEYSQVDAAISCAFSNTRRGQCGYHLVAITGGTEASPPYRKGCSKGRQ
jgi:hypothetical protein